ncbi:DUF551 domain-containing protein [Bacteroides sp. AF32-8BH]|uniref:DUF551 domain-containing protein n=1 Tax=Bacteroides sp. AF32-8BH TaxID=2302925 RepID=UPI000E41466E|nr:DUF551 domain-containing protein [Bacteroides sp. AF32-8BH]RGE77126.1 DUF551 domain-containing protein [Bacteroides sp. AF32-8BH]
MILKDIVSLLANRINQPRVIECYLRKVYAKGYEAGTKQSPWIKTKERLPEDSQEVLILMKYITPCTKVIRYQIVQCTYLKAFGMEVFESRKEKVIGWMPIPSFDEILEANRDVLERIKEKGD